MGKAELGGRSSAYKLGEAELCSAVWLLPHTSVGSAASVVRYIQVGDGLLMRVHVECVV
jgi:hypothetical protein